MGKTKNKKTREHEESCRHKGVLVKEEEEKKKGEWNLPRKEKGYVGNIRNEGRRGEGEREVICKLGNHQRGISFLIFNFNFF